MPDRRRIEARLSRGRPSSPPPGSDWGWSSVPGTGWGGGRSAGARFDYRADVGRVDLNGIVRNAIGLVSDKLPEAVLRVGRKLKKGPRKGQYVANETHELNAILRRPSPVYSARETWAMAYAGLRLEGNAFFPIVRNNADRPMYMWWVPNSRVEIHAGDDPWRPVAFYRVFGQGRTSWVDYDPADMVHIRDLPDPENPIVGIGRLRAHERSIAVVNRGEGLTAATMRNGHAGILVTPPASSGGIAGFSSGGGPMEDADVKAEVRRIRLGLSDEGFGGVAGITTPMQVQQLGRSPEELALDRILNRPAANIYAALGVPALILGDPASNDTRTYSNLGEAYKHFWDNIIAMLRVICDAVQDQLLYRRDPETGEEVGQFGDAPGLEVWADTSDVAALREDEAEKTSIWVERVTAGLCTPEYAASQLDIPEEAVPEDEDEEAKGGEGDFVPTPEEWADAADGGDEDEDGDEDGPDGVLDDEDDDETVKALFGRWRKKGKGAPGAPSTPPNVSAAAARVARGRPSPDDQRLLRAWERRKEGGGDADGPGPGAGQADRGGDRAPGHADDRAAGGEAARPAGLDAAAPRDADTPGPAADRPKRPGTYAIGGPGGKAIEIRPPREGDTFGATKLGVDGKKVGEINVGPPSPIETGAAQRQFPGIVKDHEVARRIEGIRVSDRHQGKRYGQLLYLDAMGRRPDAWLYNSQAEPGAVHAWESLRKAGLAEVHWKDDDLGGVHVARITPEGLALYRDPRRLAEWLAKASRAVKSTVAGEGSGEP